ncbi:cupredoxin domain-containing protein [Paraburkholderia adhaesiva]|uniref:cupredoxin domain-containing protein n=1 Tax=Paraburkholderia adhaesiva TaxID=2883244 RepID=UPI001F421891|nr:cupredoxin family copper-binding protein [Paraburkholderia adhaesiva]
MSGLRIVSAGIWAILCAILCVTGAGPAAARTWVVTIEQMRFAPSTLTVHRGDSVVWVNKDPVAHTVSTDAKGFDSGSIAPEASWHYVVDGAGRHPYACRFHPVMHGTLIVGPAP